MDLYIIERAGMAPKFRGTQADAKTLAREVGGTWQPIEVPDRKPERVAWLNTFAAALVQPIRQVPDAEIVQRNDGEAQREAARRMTPRDMDAGAVLARMDQPGIDAMCETICKSSGYVLARFAKSVACAFTRLEQGVR